MMYDQVGNLKSITKANGATTKYHYDSHERIDIVKDAANENTSYQYHQTGIQKVFFPNGAVRELLIDSHGRLVGMR